MGRCAIVSFRLGGTDGVSVVARRWQELLEGLGWDVVTVAGSGPVDRTVPGLEIDAPAAPDTDAFAQAIDDVDLVIVENLLSIPLNLPASRVVVAELTGRPALLHHHDPPWQRKRFEHIDELPPLDPAWVHVTINQLTARQFEQRDIPCTTIYNPFLTDLPPGNREATRKLMNVEPDQTLVVHPVRAIARKEIPEALGFTIALGGVYWLSGQAEEDYADELEKLLDETPCEVRLGKAPFIADLYAAADVVVFPSTWEGFGNPPIEAAIHCKPVAVGTYAVGSELRDLGFRWFNTSNADDVLEFLAQPDLDLLEGNRQLVEQHLSMEVIGNQLQSLLEAAGWYP